MRYVVMLLLGVFIGAMGTVSVLNALREGNALPRGLMAVLDHRLDQVRTSIEGGQCTDAQRHFEAIHLLAADIETAFLPLSANEALFSQYANDLVTRAGTAASNTAVDCRVLKEQIGSVGDGCKACHRDFK